MNHIRYKGEIYPMFGGGVNDDGTIFYGAKINGKRVKLPKDDCEIVLPGNYIKLLLARIEELEAEPLLQIARQLPPEGLADLMQQAQDTLKFWQAKEKYRLKVKLRQKENTPSEVDIDSPGTVML